MVDRVKRHLQPGERLLYEEGGFGLPGVPDPFQGGRFSGLLPERTGVEVIGGPYLHASLKTNFTQFGEGSSLAGPTGTAPFSSDTPNFTALRPYYAGARMHVVFVCENPDLIKVLEDDGTVLIGRVLGFEGDFIEGGDGSRRRPGEFASTSCPPALTDRSCCGITPCRI